MLLRFKLDKEGFRFTNPADLITARSIDYIKCKFEIDDDGAWESADAIIAVFKSPTYNKHAEILLDSFGCCYIDPEVYKHGGTIQVKLIGDRYLNEEVISSTTVTSVLEFTINENIIIPVTTPSIYSVMIADLEQSKEAVDQLIAEVAYKLAHDGFKGIGIQHISFNLDGTLTITLTDGTSFNSIYSLKGEKGEPGVYIGTEEPTDPDVSVWINPDGGPTMEPLFSLLETLFEEHPEYAVQDNSVTEVKLVNGAVTVNKLANEAVTENKIADEAVTSKKLSGIPFYNVTDYGVLPDNGDVYSELHDLIAETVYDTGGIVYFPAGKYTLSYTIFIPENTMFIGDGESTEIYFDETDRAFGVGLSNAGSNVTIKNMKVSQLTNNIPFTTGAQPGCIGFSDIAKEQAIAEKYSHSFARADAYNLTAENLVFDGFYPIQTENSATGEIRNVTYRNLYCPDGCVSVTASPACIYNVLMENVTCDLLRISANQENGKLRNVMMDNIECSNFYIRNLYETDSKIIINNLRQTMNARNNTFMTVGDAGYVSANVIFRGCVFNALSEEIYGIHEYAGKREYYNCKFNMYQRIVTRGSGLVDTDNYDIVEGCILNVVDFANTNGLILGYGKNNIVNAPDLKYCIWGDAHRSLNIIAGTNVSTNTHPARIIVEGSTIRLSCFMVITNTNLLAKLPQKFSTLPIADNAYPVTIWDISNNTARINTFAKVDSVEENDETFIVFKVNEAGLAGSTSYNRVLIETVIELTRIPTPTEVFNLLG